jgi:lipopolysaccharide export system protein LptA
VTRTVVKFASLALACALGTPALAATQKTSSNSPSFLPGGNSKEPISIDANKLVYFDKEQKAIYTGNVIVIQGDSKMTCSMLTIFLSKDAAPDPNAPKSDAGKAQPAKSEPENTEPAKPEAAKADGEAAPASSASNSQVKHMDAVGPVTIVSKTQVATGDRASYDKPVNTVWLFGHVTLSDGSNVTKGDKLTYDLTTGQALVEVDPGHRVQGQFIQGGGDGPGSGGADKGAGANKGKPTPAPTSSTTTTSKKKTSDAGSTKP